MAPGTFNTLNFTELITNAAPEHKALLIDPTFEVTGVITSVVENNSNLTCRFSFAAAKERFDKLAQKGTGEFIPLYINAVSYEPPVAEKMIETGVGSIVTLLASFDKSNNDLELKVLDLTIVKHDWRLSEKDMTTVKAMMSLPSYTGTEEEAIEAVKASHIKARKEQVALASAAKAAAQTTQSSATGTSRRYGRLFR
jgi:hypothetical protein